MQNNSFHLFLGTLFVTGLIEEGPLQQKPKIDSVNSFIENLHEFMLNLLETKLK